MPYLGLDDGYPDLAPAQLSKRAGGTNRSHPTSWDNLNP